MLDHIIDHCAADVTASRCSTVFFAQTVDTARASGGTPATALLPMLQG